MSAAHFMADTPIAGRAAQIVHWLRAQPTACGDLHSDSRSVRSGDVFLAWPGRAGDGRRHIRQALQDGARFALFEPFDCPGDLPTDLRVLPVAGLRTLAGELASLWYGRPSERTDLIAVTGTNGKTSCTRWVAEGLTAAGKPSAVIGTLGSGLVGERPSPFGLTMPDAVSLHRLLAGLVDRGARAVAIEASSIGIDQGRLDGAHCKLAMLTNITRDHLDYHGTEQAYREAKLRLFERPSLSIAVLNADDPACDQGLDRLRPSCERIVYGERALQFDAGAARRLQVRIVREDSQGMDLALAGDFGSGEARVGLLGRFNAINASGVAACWLALGLPFDEALARLAQLSAPPGRLERIERDGQPLVVVDYAHTPDALEHVLAAMRVVAKARGGQLWCVFGAGGDRDEGKRPMMGQVVSAGCDHFIITSDNPRSESPERIAAQIGSGCVRAPQGIELDRGHAIARAIRLAAALDVVLVAGKGHECWQEIAGKRLAFSDREVAERELDARAEALHV
jgi:UDP-N-acetylmuramoyl-L-alanyl-D-glutamate--2,6-diaminopimelate ligase